MPPYHGAPRPTRVRAAPRTDWRSAACTVHVRRHCRERPRRLGRGVGLGKVRVLGRRATSSGGASDGVRARTWRARARGRGVAAHGTADPTCFADTMFEHYLLQNLNRSWPNFEYENCRSSNPLSISKRLYGVLLNKFCRKRLPTLNATRFSWTGDTDLWASFSCFSTKIWNANLHERCVPQ
jgi:hypothetical protein